MAPSATNLIKPEPTERPVTDSQVVMNEMVLPNDANVLGNVLGGHVMHLMDMCAAMSAMRHCRKVVVTASVDHLSFVHPVKVGELMILKASVNYADHTSMEVGVRIEAEQPLTGEKRHTSSAYLTFVALDERGRPTPVPKVVPVTEDDKRRFEAARSRREDRLRRMKGEGNQPPGE
ncbi:MAG: acyl-CoA thioesterase [Fidelibacterota bacterium]|nr:MAG: acyl-CoA thioesterase [Candidatus Neomarinimicrobiota bacterium]